MTRGDIALIAGTCIMTLGLTIWGIGRRRAASLGLARAFCCVIGYGHQTPPIAQFSAAFTPTSNVYPPRFGQLSIPMVVKNDENLPVIIFKANGGCSGREIDHAKGPS